MSFTTQIDYVVTGLDKLNAAVSDLKSVALAQTQLQKSSNDLTRQLAAVSSSGFEALAKSVSAATVAQEKNTAANTSQVASIKALAASINSLDFNLDSLIASYLSTTAASEKMRTTMASIVVATGEVTVALRGEIAATMANTAAISQMEAAQAKLAAVTAERLNLESGATAAMDKRLATEKALTAVAQQLYAADKLSLMSLQQRIIAESELTSTQKLRAMQELGLVSMIDDVDRANKNSAKSTEDLNKKTKDLDGSSKLLKNSQTELGSAFRGVGAATGTLFLTYGQLIPMITAFVTASTAIKAINLGAEFEYQVQYITSVQEGMNKLSFDEIYEGLLSIKGLAQTPTELADAMTVFVKAGIPAAAALKEIEQLSKFAIVTQEDVAKSAELVAGQWNAWGPSSQAAERGVRSMTEAMNIMAATTIISQSDIEQIKTAMKYLNMLAVTSDVTYVQVQALSASMANMGIQGSMSATSIRNALINLGKDYKGLVDSFNEMGVTSFMPYGKSDVEVLESFIASLSELSIQQRRTFADSELGKRALATLGLTLDENAKSAEGASMTYAEMVKFLKEVQAEAKYLDTIFNDLSTTTKLKMDEVGAAWERALIKAFDAKAVSSAMDALIAALDSEALVQGITSLVSIGTSFVKLLTDVADSGAADAISALADGVDKLFAAIGSVPGWVLAGGGLIAAIFFGGAGTALAAVGAATLTAVSYVYNFTGSLKLAEEGIISMDTALSATNAERAALIQAYKDIGTEAEQAKLKTDQLALSITNRDYSAAISKLDELVTKGRPDESSDFSTVTATSEYDTQTEALREQVKVLGARKEQLEANIKSVTSHTSTNALNAAGVVRLTEAQKIEADINKKLTGGKVVLTSEVDKLNAARRSEYEALSANIEAQATSGATETWITGQKKKLEYAIYGTTKAQAEMTAAVEKDKEAMDTAGESARKLAKETENLGKMTADTLPEGLSKDLAEWADKYKAEVDKVKDATTLSAEVQAEKLKNLAAEYKTGGDTIKSEFSDKIQKSVAEIGNSLDRLAGKDASLSTLDAGVIKISEDFDKWGVTAAAALKHINDQKPDDLTAEMKKTKAELEAMIAKAPELEKEMKKAFETKLVEDFDESLADLVSSFDELTPYESTLKGIKDKFQDMRDEANKNWKEGTAGATTLAQKLAEIDEKEQKVLKNNTELAKQGNNLWDGFIAGAKDAAKEMTSLGELGYEAFGTLETAWKDGFYAVITGDMDSLSDVWDSLLSSLLRAFSDFVAQLLLKWAAAAILDMTINVNGSSFGSGTESILSGLGSIFSSSGGGPSALAGGSAGGDVASLAAAEAAQGTAWQTAAGYAGMGIGAYGVYSGARNISEGNYGTGALQTGLGAVAMYKGAVAADLLAEGTATEIAKGAWAGVKSYFGSSASAATTEAIGTQIGAATAEWANTAYVAGKGATSYATFQAPASATGAGAGGAMAGLGAVGAFMAAVYALNNIGGETPTISPADSMNAMGMTPDDLSAIAGGWKLVTDTVLDLDASLEQFGVGMQTIGEVTYNAQESMLYYTTGLGVMGAAFDESTQTWSEAAVGMKLDAMQLGESAQAASSQTVSAAASIISSYTGTSTSMSTAAEIANFAANSYQDLAVSESGASTYAIDLQWKLQSMGLSASDAAAAAQDLISQMETEASATSTVSEVAAGASSSLGGFATAITESAASASVAATSVSSAMSSITSSLGGFAVAAGSTADSLRKATGSFSDVISSSGSRAMGGIIGRANGGSIGLATGGLLTGGSGVRDDLYIGSVDGVKYMAMGGEFVVNKRATANNRELLEAINDGKSISGGSGQVIHNHFYVDGKEITTTIMPAVDKHVTDKANRGALKRRTAY